MLRLLKKPTSFAKKPRKINTWRFSSTYAGKKTLQIASDLHIENYPDPKLTDFITPSSPNLALVGDIGIPYMPSYSRFLDECSKTFENTYLITGNHEYYQHKNEFNKRLTMVETNELIGDLVKKYKNIHYLNNNSASLYDYTILGTTLWSPLPLAQEKLCKMLVQSMNDYRMIFKSSSPSGIKTEITDNDVTTLYYNNFNWLGTNITQHSNNKVIVLSHHLPSYKLVAPQYKNSWLNFCFASDSDRLMLPNVKYWFCGHTHTAMNKMIGGCRCIVNPFGYSGENGHNGYKRDLVVTLE